MPKQQKRLKFDYLQPSVLQCQKYAVLLPFAFCICQNNKTSAKGFIFMFSQNVCQKAMLNSFDFLNCLVERLFYAVLTFDYFFSQSLMFRPNVGPMQTDQQTGINSEITGR